MNKEKLFYPFYLLSHPFDGFYEIRHREEGSVPLALLLVSLFSISFSLNRRYASFVVNDVNPRTVNSFLEMIAIFGMVFLFSVANWSITCLMEGEGRFKDIITVVGYSMLPMVLIFIPATIISQFIANGEEAFYYLLLIVAIAWSLLWMLIGIMTIHNFTFGKTMLTIFITFIAVLIIIFLALLLISLIQQVFLFFVSLYIEVVLRI